MRFLRSYIQGEWFEFPFPETMDEAFELCGQDETAVVNLIGIAISHNMGSLIRSRMITGYSIEEIDNILAEWYYQPKGPYREDV